MNHKINKYKNNFSNTFNKASTIIAISIILGTVTYAWTGPGALTPETGNTPAPVNVGTLLQEKMGSLKVRGPFTITGGNKGYSELTQDADDPSTLTTKSYVDSKIGTVLFPDCTVGSTLVYGDGGNWICVLPGSREYVAPGAYNFDVPSGIYSLNVEVQGAGGSGGTGIQGGLRGTGGKAGARVIQTLSVTPGQSFNVVVGAGGTTVDYYYSRVYGVNGNPGSQSIFGSITASGGAGGIQETSESTLEGKPGENSVYANGGAGGVYSHHNSGINSGGSGSKGSGGGGASSCGDCNTTSGGKGGDGYIKISW